MSSQKGGVFYTPDFSTLDGSATWWKYGCKSELQAFNSTYVARNTYDALVGYRYKSAVVRGIVDPLSGVRRATNYSRIIHTCTNFHQTFEWWRPDGWPAGTIRRYKQDSPLGMFGLFIQSGGYYSSTTGAVNVSNDYAARAETEALLALKEQRVNYGVAIAELGEVFSWVGTLVTRLVDVLRTVRDVLRGKIRRSAAHRILYGNRKIYSLKGVSGSRWSPFFGVPSGKSPQHWSDEAYRRFLRAEGRRYRREFKKKRSKREFVGGAWLEYQYAIMPLVYDIYGTLENLKKGLGAKPMLLSVQRTIGGPVNLSALATCNHTPYTCTGSVRQSARVVFTGQMDTSPLGKLDSLGLLNPWEVAWELVPFSFVLDWVVPIGNVLRSFTAPLGVRFVDGYMDRVVSGQYSAKATMVHTGQSPEAKIKLTAFQRVRYLGWPLPDFYTRSPWSYPHVINAIALVAVLTKWK